MSTGFGQWYEERKAQENGDNTGNGASSMSFMGVEGLPLFSAEAASESFSQSFNSMRSSLEAQLPQKIMGMNYQQRFQVFCALLFLSALFFGLGFAVGLPMIAVRPQKFALCFTFGSLTFMGSFGILKGPVEHLRGMFALDRLPFTCVYIGSMLATLYCTFNIGGMLGYVLVLSSSGAQLVALLWYLISFLPGGSAGLTIVLKAMGRILQPVVVGCAKMQAWILGRCLGLSST